MKNTIRSTRNRIEIARHWVNTLKRRKVCFHAFDSVQLVAAQENIRNIGKHVMFTTEQARKYWPSVWKNKRSCLDKNSQEMFHVPANRTFQKFERITQFTPKAQLSAKIFLPRTSSVKYVYT